MTNKMKVGIFNDKKINDLIYQSTWYWYFPNLCNSYLWELSWRPSARWERSCPPCLRTRSSLRSRSSASPSATSPILIACWRASNREWKFSRYHLKFQEKNRCILSFVCIHLGPSCSESILKLCSIICDQKVQLHWLRCVQTKDKYIYYPWYPSTSSLASIYIYTHVSKAPAWWQYWWNAPFSFSFARTE